MSAANPIANAPATSTWESVQNAFVDSGKWVSRQVTALFSGIKHYAVKIYEWAKPFFVNMSKFFAESYQKVKEFVMDHKEAVGTGTVLFFVGVIFTLICQSVCCSSDKPNTDAAKA